MTGKNLEPVTPYQTDFIEDARKRVEAMLQTDIIALPQCGGDRRAAPNNILRSALFNARNHKHPRRYIKDETIAVIGDGCSIGYRGEELRQDDETVWLHLIFLAKNVEPGERIFFTPTSFLREIGWDGGGKSFSRLATCISRLNNASVRFDFKNAGYIVGTNLLAEFAIGNKEDYSRMTQWSVRIHSEIHRLFSLNSYTLIDYNQRKKLPSGIASKLHGYYSSHKNPYPIKIATIKLLCGIEINHPGTFLRQLKIALESLVEAGFLSSWEIKNGIVSVKKTTS